MSMCRVSSVGGARDAVGIARRRRYRPERRPQRGGVPRFISGIMQVIAAVKRKLS